MVHWKRHYLNATEAFRCTVELSQFPKGLGKVLKQAPKGDGHPVMVIPPFTGDDKITTLLRFSLEKAGYKVYGWENGHNIGFNDKKGRNIYEHLKEVYESNGRQKISLIGWSLGGIYARELAREYPDMVRQDITLFTPFGVGMHKDATPPTIVAAISMLSNSKYLLSSEGMAERLVTPPPVPTTSIYSKGDGIGGWEACLNPKAPLAENVEVGGSHIGGGWNLEALTVILDRLAQPEGKWKPFEPKDPCPKPNSDWENKPAAKKKFFPAA